MTVTTMKKMRYGRIRSITISEEKSMTTSANNEVSYIWCDHLNDGA